MSSGGARLGAGRKPKPDKKVTIAVRVEPEIKEIIRKLSKRQQITQSTFLEQLINTALKG